MPCSTATRRRPPTNSVAFRAEVTRQLTPDGGRGLTVNLRPDCAVVLPREVAAEAERALTVMARLSPHPNGPPHWQDYRARFLERYSLGALVPVRELVDPDTGLGFPAGFRGSVLNRPVQGTTSRDERLLALAQEAALTGAREVALTEEDIEALGTTDRRPVPAHVELCFTVLAKSLPALRRGHFQLVLGGLSLSAGTTTGRFLAALGDVDRRRVRAALAALPTLDVDAARVQVSAPPLRTRTQNVARAPATARHLLPLGEQNPGGTLTLDELAVGADTRRLYLVSLTTGQRLEPTVLNAVEPTNATHPLVRFLTEVHRSHTAVLAPFAWGAAARLPFLPAVRVGRTVLSPASWRLSAGTSAHRTGRIEEWRERYRVPRFVFAGSNDQRLRLDLDDAHHLRLLRGETERAGATVVQEAPEDDAYGWLGRPHEIALPFASTLPPANPPMPHGTVIRRSDGRLPGTSRWACVKLYCHVERAPEILSNHLPALLDGLGNPAPRWWFTRYADPATHIRLRLALPDRHFLGEAIRQVGAWAATLRDEGLVSRVQWDTDEPEIGRYGTGHALDAAEDFFAADSAATLAQQALVLPTDLRPALTAASFLDLATAFTGSHAAGHRWLLDNLARDEGPRPERAAQQRTVLLSAPDAAALRGLPGGSRVLTAWAHRRTALSTYRTALSGQRPDPETVLPSLLHMHHNRAAGTDPEAEATCRRLARGAALSLRARRGEAQT